MSSMEWCPIATNVSNDSFVDSDVTSDVEAELYSQIYFLDCSTNVQFNETPNSLEGINESEKNKESNVSNSKSVVRTLRSGTNDWRIIGNTLKRPATPKIKVLGPFETFRPQKSIHGRNKRLIVMTDSSECEVLMEVLPMVAKPEKTVPVIQLTSSSDEELNVPDSKIDESFTLNLNVESCLHENESSRLDSSLISKDNKTSKKRKRIPTRRISDASTDIDEMEDATQVPYQFNPELRHDGSLSISKDLWSLNAKDKFKQSFRETDYYREKARLNRIICHNCKVAGHLSKHCLKPRRLERCYLCGHEGHNADWCPNPACSQCQRIGHTFRQCLWGSDNLKYHCSICKSRGHLREECPDIWRRYYRTSNRDEVSPTLYVSNPRQFCCNCGKEGHLAENCAKKTMDDYLVITTSHICSYFNPTDYLVSFNRKAQSREDKVRNTLFAKKSDLTIVANEKYLRTLNGVYSTYSRDRTRSDGPLGYRDYPRVPQQPKQAQRQPQQPKKDKRQAQEPKKDKRQAQQSKNAKRKAKRYSEASGSVNRDVSQKKTSVKSDKKLKKRLKWMKNKNLKAELKKESPGKAQKKKKKKKSST